VICETLHAGSKRARYSRITVDGDKSYFMHERALGHGAPVVNLADRLMNETVRMIEHRLLKSPAATKRDDDAANARLAAAAKKVEDREAKKFKDRARSALGHSIIGARAARIIDRIVEAMKWAQTQ